MRISKVVLNGLLLASALMPIAAHADSLTVLDGTDITDAIHYFAPMVTQLNKSITIYNWSPKEPARNTSETLGDAQGRARRFWRLTGDAMGAGMMYGYGLYGAADPILTQSYGGGSTNWRLLVMQLPVGLKLLDLPHLTGAYTAPLPPSVAQVMTKFNCPAQPSPDGLFQSGGYSLNPTCRGLMKRIFSDILQIDAISYQYGQTYFQECTNDYGVANRAFVVMNDEWMTDSNSHYYTADSTDNVDARAMVETLFLGTSQLQFDAKAVNSQIASYFNRYPDRDLISSTATCDSLSSYCSLNAHFCDQNSNCEDVTLGFLPRPGGGLLTAAEANRSYKPFLWPDLEGKPKATTVKEYLLGSQFGCDGKLPYNGAK